MTPYSAAVISDCGRYRYELIRRWGNDPMLEFIMLNPSTADANKDDPTIRRCIGFAKRWGYGALVVRNLYAYRATSPTILAAADDPIGPLNAAYLGNNIAHCTVVAWGANPAVAGWLQGYPYDITKSLRRPRFVCLGLTTKGHPRHPLYIPSSFSPIEWTSP